jgi:AcrR family transcriptional regulator
LATLALKPVGTTVLADSRAQEIVAVAFDLLDEAGLEGLTIRTVLLRTGLARRAFYERFAGKDDLVVAVFAHAIRLAAINFGEAVTAIADPMARLELLITSIALGASPATSPADTRAGRRGAAMSREHLRLADTRPADLRAALRPLTDLITRLLADGMAAGVVRVAPPERLAMLVYNLVSTTTHAELLAQEATPADRASRVALAADVWDFCRRAIVA